MNENEEQANIALSGWVGAGTSTLTLILAILLKYKYIPITRIFRLIDEKLGFNDDGKSLKAEFENVMQPTIGKTIDNYVSHKLLSDSGIILESDLSTFRIGKHPKVFSIFLKADKEIRTKRVIKQGRKDIEASIEERDDVLRQQYINLWETDIFDEELIDRKYNLVLDNSQINLVEETKLAIISLSKHPSFKNRYEWDKVLKKVEIEVKKYTEKGKSQIIQRLTRGNYIMTAEEMMLEVVQLFPEDVEQFPQNVQKLFLGQL